MNLTNLQRIRLEYLLNFVYGIGGKYPNKEGDSFLRDILKNERGFDKIKKEFHPIREISKAVKDILNDKTL